MEAPSPSRNPERIRAGPGAEEWRPALYRRCTGVNAKPFSYSIASSLQQESTPVLSNAAESCPLVRRRKWTPPKDNSRQVAPLRAPFPGRLGEPGAPASKAGESPDLSRSLA